MGANDNPYGGYWETQSDGQLKFISFPTINAARQWHGLKPYDFPEADTPAVHTQYGHVLVEGAEKITEPIEDEASRLVRNGERQQSYGHPRGDFDQIAAYWSADLLGKLKDGESVNAYDVAQMMISLKKARLKSNPHHRDSKVDIIGYTICHDRLDEPQ